MTVPINMLLIVVLHFSLRYHWDGAYLYTAMESKAYLRHLFHAQELLAMQIASIHNLAFYLWLAGEARKHIIAGDFATWKPMMVKRVSTRL